MAPTTRETLGPWFQSVRAHSRRIAEPLAVEDTVVQSMPDVSPTKWHLAHTTWFFETFVLEPFEPEFAPVQPLYRYLFNSYYQQVGPQFSRPARGQLSRPTLAEVLDYRRIVDARTLALLDGASEQLLPTLIERLTIGLHHERQHQELMLTDLKHVLGRNPLEPAYAPAPTGHLPSHRHDTAFLPIAGGVVEIGAAGPGFCFDNESPRHSVLVHEFELARDLTTVADYLAFIDDGGYLRPELWLSDGWQWVEQSRAQAPLYWVPGPDDWRERSLYGGRDLDHEAPLCHVNFYEAEAYARWAGARLPTEFEWEHAFATRSDRLRGSLLDDGHLHPIGRSHAGAADRLRDMIGEVWEWTASAYLPYPGYRPAPGALGEYNGKFMSGQMVLRGGSVATAADHIRPSYRNFFQPDKQWQFTGLRLARDIDAS